MCHLPGGMSSSLSERFQERSSRTALRAFLLQVTLAVALCLIATAQPLLLETAKRGNGGQTPFHAPSAVFYTEAIKVVIALSTWMWQCRTASYTGLENFKPTSMLAFALPAVLFAVQNNLVYVAMQALDPPTFQLWACFKLIPVGVLSSLVLERRLTRVQWIALLLLAIGMAVTTQGGGSGRRGEGDANGPATKRQLRGIAVLVVNGCLSGLSTVFNEWLIKFQDPKARTVCEYGNPYLLINLLFCARVFPYDVLTMSLRAARCSQAPLMFKNLQIYVFGTLFCAWGLQPKLIHQFATMCASRSRTGGLYLRHFAELTLLPFSSYLPCSSYLPYLLSSLSLWSALCWVGCLASSSSSMLARGSV